VPRGAEAEAAGEAEAEAEAKAEAADPAGRARRFVGEAVRNADAALEVYERASMPAKYAEAWAALGEAHARLADLGGAPAGGERGCLVCGSLLAARAAYQRVLGVVTRGEDAERWARTHMWLAQLALRYRAHTRALGGGGAAAHAPVEDGFGAPAAAASLRAAGEVFTAREDGVMHGNVQHLLGVAWLAIVEDGAGGDGGEGGLGEGTTAAAAAAARTARVQTYRAVKCFTRALGVKTWSFNAGFDYSNTVACLDGARRKLAALQAAAAVGGDEDDLSDASGEDGAGAAAGSTSESGRVSR
jgi:hypothetical protein